MIMYLSYQNDKFANIHISYLNANQQFCWLLLYYAFYNERS